jgi:hypothetical protein
MTKSAKISIHSKCLFLYFWVTFMVFTGPSVFAQIGGGVAIQEIKPMKPLEFKGWEYNKIGYSLNPGEELNLIFENTKDSILNVPVSWTLSTYQGIFLTKGKTELVLQAKQMGSVPIDLQAEMKDGPYMIKYSPEMKGWNPNNPFYFDYRKATPDKNLNLNLVAMIDNMDPEGWVRILLGNLAPFANVQKSFPKNTSGIDAVVLINEGLKSTDAQFAQLQNYVKQGGFLLIFGRTSSALDELIPVIPESVSKVKEQPLQLRITEDVFGSGFTPANGPLHYPIRVKVKNQGKILADYSDGSPAVISGSYGKGKVVYVAGGSGQVWEKRPSLEGADELALRLLYFQKGGQNAVKSMIEFAEKTYRDEVLEQNKIRDKVAAGLKISPPENFVVVGRDNVGRFGWINEEGTLTDNIFPDGRVMVGGERDWQIRGASPMVMNPLMTYSISASGVSSPVIAGVKQNWFSKTSDWKYPNGEMIHSTISLGTPGILWEGKSSTIGISCKSITHFAFLTTKGIQIIKSGESIDPSAMEENWILGFTALDKVQDMPQLFVFTKKPKSIVLKDGVLLNYGNDGFGAIFTSRIWGIRRLAPGKTMEWINAIPEHAVADASRWSRVFLNFPVDCDEIGWIKNDSVLMGDHFTFRNFESDWKTKPLQLTVIPPVYLLAKNIGSPVSLPKNLIDLNCPTTLGPLMAVEGNASLVSTAIPINDHRASIPVDGKMILQDEIDYRAGGLGFQLNSSPPGRSEGGGNFHVDIEEYENPKRLPYNLQACIDPYKWWYTFNGLLARPSYSPSVREKVDIQNDLRYYETLNYYSHKCMVVQKREPFTGIQYLISFVWPTQTQNGYRNFNDANEASGLIAYSYANYARYYGDWTTIEANWNHCRRLYEYLPKVNDWACMSSGALENWNVAGLDMLNTEPYGNLAYAYAAKNAGYPKEELLGIVLGTRAMVPTVARLNLQDYLKSITEEGDALRQFTGFYHFAEQGIMGSKRKMGGVGLFDTSKGTFHEFLLGYKTWAPLRMKEELSSMGGQGRDIGRGSASPDNMMRILLGSDIETFRQLAPAGSPEAARRPVNWQSTTSLYELGYICTADVPVFLSDWTPAELVSGNYNPQAKIFNIKFKSWLGKAFMVRIYSQYEPNKLTVNGKEINGKWKYDAKTGWLDIQMEGIDDSELIIHLGKAVAPLHPYIPVTKL